MVLLGGQKGLWTVKKYKAISKGMRSAPKSRILMSDPELQARGSELSNALQINVARYNKLKGFWFTFSELESKIFHKLAE